MSKISVITINYNNLEGLKKTVESIVNQTWQEFEYIVIDGGSSDGSVEYIESQSVQIDYWVSEPDKGVYNAMNKGIKKATGEYLLFLNSGDHFYNNIALEKAYKALGDKDLVYFNLNFVNKTTSRIHRYTDRLFFSFFITETLPHPATFIRATLFDKFGLYDESLKIASDWKFFLECVCKYNVSYMRIDETLSTFYLDGLSSDPENIELIFKERQYVLESNFSSYLVDIRELNSLKKVISNLKKSKKIKLLIRLKLLDKF